MLICEESIHWKLRYLYWFLTMEVALLALFNFIHGGYQNPNNVEGFIFFSAVLLFVILRQHYREKSLLSKVTLEADVEGSKITLYQSSGGKVCFSDKEIAVFRFKENRSKTGKLAKHEYEIVSTNGETYSFVSALKNSEVIVDWFVRNQKQRKNQRGQSH